MNVKRFVPKEVYTQYGENACWFVSNNIYKLVKGAEALFLELLKTEYPDIQSVELVVNNWYDKELIKICGDVFNNRGLRTYTYIKSQVDAGKPTATLSQHVGGSTNAVDGNLLIALKSGKKFLYNSDKLHDLITKNEKAFMALGLTTLEDKSITKGWTHMDCRYTGLNTLLIVKP
jgi:hypothetical protein